MGPVRGLYGRRLHHELAEVRQHGLMVLLLLKSASIPTFSEACVDYKVLHGLTTCERHLTSILFAKLFALLFLRLTAAENVLQKKMGSRGGIRMIVDLNASGLKRFFRRLCCFAVPRGSFRLRLHSARISKDLHR